MKVCADCGKPQSKPELICCEHCHGSFVERENVRALSKEELKSITEQLCRSWRFWGPVGIGIVGLAWLIGGIFDYLADLKVKNFIEGEEKRMTNALTAGFQVLNSNVAFQLEQPRVQETLSNVVSQQATQLLITAVSPTISNFQKIVDSKIVDVTERAIKAEKQADSLAWIGSDALRNRTTLNRGLRFTPEAAQRFVTILKAGPPSTAEIVYSPGDDEAYEFASTIAGFLNGSGWMVIGPKPIPVNGKFELGTLPLPGSSDTPLAIRLGAQPMLGGVSLIYGPGAQGNMDNEVAGRDLKTWKAGTGGEAIFAALRDAQFSLAGSYGGPNNNLKDGSVIIVIGQR